MTWPTTRQPTDALTGEFVPEVWSARVINHVRSNLVCVNVVNTTWKTELAKGDILTIPVMAGLTAAVVNPAYNTTGVNTNMNQTVSTTATTLTIDKWYEVPVSIDDSSKIQSNVSDLLNIIADNAAYALEKVIDTDVNSIFSDLGSGVYGSDGQTFTDDIMIALMEYLDEGDVPRENRSLVIDPSTIADIYKIDKFVRMDYQKESVIPSGKIGQIYGVPVYVTNNLTATTTGSYGCLLHRDAIGLAIQDGPTVEKWRDGARHSDIINVSALWGADNLRDTFGRPFYTRLK